VSSASTVTRNELSINESEAHDISKQHAYITTVVSISQSLMPVIKKNQTHFIIEEEKQSFNINTYALNVVLDIYSRDFQKHT